jgi:hypothetical protein
VKSLAPAGPANAALSVLSHYRVEFYNCLYKRADALFELTDAVLCADGPVTSLVELTLTAEHRCGHGATYDGVNHGWLEPRRLWRLLASTPLPRAADGRIVFAVDVSNWLRFDAVHPGLALLLRRRAGDREDIMDRVLDAIRLGPADDATNWLAWPNETTSKPGRQWHSCGRCLRPGAQE